MTEPILMLLSCLLVGLALAGVVVGCWPRIRRWQRNERQWIQETALRFNPEPVDAAMWQWVYLATRALLFVVLLLTIPSLVITIVLWVGLLFVPKQAVEFFWQRRRRKIDDQIPAAVLTMSHNVHAGLSLVQAIQRLADRAPAPIRTEFRIMANRYALGSDFEQTIRETQDRLKLANMNLFVSALLVNREMGGNISITLERIAHSLEKLKELRQTVKASTAEGRTNIKALSVAPVLVVGLLYLMDPEGVALVFNTPQGFVVLGIIATLNAMGIFWASKIVGSEF